MQSTFDSDSALPSRVQQLLSMGLIKKEPAAPEVVIIEPEVDTRQDVIVPIATHLLALAVGAVLGKLLGGKILSGRRVGAHKKHQKAFVLTVQYGFEHVAARDRWLGLFKTLAQHVADEEKDTLAYEVSVSEDDPTKILIYERYTNKDSAFVQVHRSSEPFKAIKQLAAQHACEPISSTGQGWTEQDIGFMCEAR